MSTSPRPTTPRKSGSPGPRSHKRTRMPGNGTHRPQIGLKRTAAELRVLKDELAAELDAMKRLHELSTHLLADGDLASMLAQTLACTMALQNADFGSVQLYNAEAQHLELVANCNFPDQLAQRYAIVRDGSTCCGRAMLRRERVVIEDMRADAELADSLAWAEFAGMRSAQSTPLFGRGGELLGMITTLFGRAHRPSEHELRMTDLCARQAAQLIERKRVDAALRRSQAYLAAAERLSHTGSWAWSPGRRDLYWSDEMFVLFGCDAAKGTPAYEATFDLMHPEDSGPLRRGFEAAIQTCSEFEAEWRIVHADGSVRHVHSLAQPVFDAHGALVEYLGTATDITQRKLSEAALAQAHEELAHLTRVMSMGELAASVAHEVNQPLAAIVTNGNACLRWLARQPASLAEAQQAVERIVRDGIRAGEVVGRIRAYASKTAPHTSALDLNEVVRQSLALAHGEMLRCQLVLSLQLQDDLPAVQGDRIQLQQVIMNVVINAIESMRGVFNRPRELVVRTYANESGVTVSVRDGGAGLSKLTVDRLFDPFFTTKTDGMGLGLAICRRIVEAHGGQVWAMGNDGPGATVGFSIPHA